MHDADRLELKDGSKCVDTSAHCIHSHNCLTKAISAPNTTSHTNNRIADTTIDTTPDTMATQRLPLKNASQSGSFVP